MTDLVDHALEVEQMTEVIKGHWKYSSLAGDREFVASHERVGMKVAGLDGPALNAMDVAAHCRDAGWIDTLELWKALATFLSESLLHVEAFHHNLGPDGSVASTDWGPCQLNDKAHPEFFPNGDHMVIACNPERCFKAAHDIYSEWGYSFNAWFGWKNQVALDDYYLRRASIGIANYTARKFRADAISRPVEIAGRVTPATKTPATFVTLAQLRTIYPPGS